MLNIKFSITKRAFTLVEMLISITIFMIFIAILGGSYTALVRANRTANETQKTYREIRFVFDTLASEVRGGRLDYSCFDVTQLDALCIENQKSEEKKVIAVLHENGFARTLYKFADKKVLVLKQKRAALEAVWTTVFDWESLSGAEIIDTGYFKVFPLRDPYASANAADDNAQWQPTVTIALEADGKHFRTTYASRAYGKKILYE